MAAALRRLGASLRNGALLQQTPSNGRRELKVVAAGACVAAAAGAAALYCGSVVGVGPRSRVEARLVHLALPTVSATDKVP